MSTSKRGWAAFAVAALALSLLAACAPDHIDAPAGAAPLRYRDSVFPSIDTAKDLQYGSAVGVTGNQEALRLDVYQPQGDTAALRPALVWVHGGGFSGGDKATSVSTVLARNFARRGYVTVSINYRLLVPSGCGGSATSECTKAAIEAIHDGQAAVRWLRANASTFRIDPNRIGIGGESAGAIVAYGVGVLSDQPGTSGNPEQPSNVAAWVSISGGAPGGAFVSPGDAPGYLFSGTADRTVPYQWSVETKNALLAAQVPVVFRTFQGAGHVPFAEYGDVMDEQSASFFYRYLDVAHLPG